MFQLSYINVTDPAYGAIGDGIANDAEAIQKAIDAAQACGGATVFFPCGTYKVQLYDNPGPNQLDRITLYSDVILLGSGGASSLVFSMGSAPPILNPERGYIEGNKKSNIRISLLEFDCLDSEKNLITFTDCNAVEVDTCSFSQTKTTDVSGITILGFFGVSVPISGSSYSDYSVRNSFFKPTNHALLFQGAVDAQLTNSVVQDNIVDGDLTYARPDEALIHFSLFTSYFTVQHNKIDGKSKVIDSIGFIGTEGNGICSYNEIKDIKRSGIAFFEDPLGDEIANVNVVGNLIVNTLGWIDPITQEPFSAAIAFSYLNQSIRNINVSGNIIDDAEVVGIFQQGFGVISIQITGNILRNTEIFGIAFQALNAIITNNVVDTVELAGIYFFLETDNILFENVTINKNVIRSIGLNNPNPQDVLGGIAVYYDSLTPTSTMVSLLVEENTIIDSVSNGLFVWQLDISSCMIRSNTIIDTESNAILLMNAGDKPLMSNNFIRSIFDGNGVVIGPQVAAAFVIGNLLDTDIGPPSTGVRISDQGGDSLIRWNLGYTTEGILQAVVDVGLLQPTQKYYFNELFTNWPVGLELKDCQIQITQANGLTENWESNSLNIAIIDNGTKQIESSYFLKNQASSNPYYADIVLNIQKL